MKDILNSTKYRNIEDVCLSCCRDKAEQTIWNKLQMLTAMKRKRLKAWHTPMKIGILGKALHR